jgi:hypothetical protein
MRLVWWDVSMRGSTGCGLGTNAAKTDDDDEEEPSEDLNKTGNSFLDQAVMIDDPLVFQNDVQQKEETKEF